MMRIAMLLLVAWPLSAQPAPAGQDCAGVLAATLASGDAHPRLEACAAAVVPALGAATGDAALETDPARLATLHRLGFFIRDPRLYEAGLALGQRGDASPAARVLGLSVALRQVDRQLAFQSTGGERPFQAPLSETCAEATFLTVDGVYWADHGVADQAEARLRRVVQALARELAEPLMVRRFARCVALVLPDAAPPSFEVPEWEDGA